MKPTQSQIFGTRFPIFCDIQFYIKAEETQETKNAISCGHRFSNLLIIRSQKEMCCENETYPKKGKYRIIHLDNKVSGSRQSRGKTK